MNEAIGSFRGNGNYLLCVSVSAYMCIGLLYDARKLATKVDADERLEKLLIQLLYNLSGFKNNQQKLGKIPCAAHLRTVRNSVAGR